MSDKKNLSVAEILAAARQKDGGGGGGSKPAPAAESSVASPEAAVSTVSPAPGTSPAPAPGSKLNPAAMCVADMIAAAKAEKSKGPKTEAATAKPAAKTAEAKPAESKPAPQPKVSTAAEKAKPAAAASPMETTSILAAARKGAKPGPMSKAEASAKDAAATTKAAPQKVIVPPMPEKPAYVMPKRTEVVDAQDRRNFFASFASVMIGSSMAIGFISLAVTNLLWVLGFARFMFPNILTEPPTRFKVGFPDDFAPGQVETKFIAEFGVWIVRYEYEGQPQIYALKSVCTHLGCTPNWLDGEQKFKCPCHGSGFYKDGINFEGPAPRPLERYAIRVADDGQIEVDKSRKFNEELGQWKDSASYVPV